MAVLHCNVRGLTRHDIQPAAYPSLTQRAQRAQMSAAGLWSGIGARSMLRQRGWTISARDGGGASAMLWAWSTCPECRDRRSTG